jgi:hypothetical protein
MKGNFRRYADQITQKIIAFLHIWKNWTQDQGSENKKSRRVAESHSVCLGLNSKYNKFACQSFKNFAVKSKQIFLKSSY